MAAVLETKTTTLRGGEWLVKDAQPQDIFTAEGWNEEQRNMAQMIKDFLVNEVHPRVPDMDTMQHPEMMPALLKKAGELGLLGISIPEEYGGLGLDFTTGMLTTEINGMGHSYSVAMAAHTGMGTLPMLYYGTEEQKQKYIPKLASGEWLPGSVRQ